MFATAQDRRVHEHVEESLRGCGLKGFKEKLSHSQLHSRVRDLRSNGSRKGASTPHVELKHGLVRLTLSRSDR